MEHRTDRGDISHLLKELHNKKKWLDTMIAGLEAAVDSPHIKLVEAADRALSSSSNGPKVDLKPGQANELANLAAQAGGSRRRRRSNRAVVNAA